MKREFYGGCSSVLMGHGFFIFGKSEHHQKPDESSTGFPSVCYFIFGIDIY